MVKLLRWLTFAAVSALTAAPALAADAPAAQASSSSVTPMISDTASGLSVELAIEAAKTAIASCKRRYGDRVTAIVLDADAVPLVMLRYPDADPPSVEVARRKAYTVIKKGMASGDFGKSINWAPAPVAPDAQVDHYASAGVSDDPSIVPFAGGLPINIKGRIVAALGVAGAIGNGKDVTCAADGLARIKQHLR